MGNQNTSGITPEAPEIARVGSTHDQGSEGAENEVSEEIEGSVNEDPETQTNDFPNGSIDYVEPKETCFEEEVIPDSNDEMQDQPYTLKEEMQTSEIYNPEDSPSLLQSADITSEPREDHDVILETVESLLPADDSEMIQSDETDNEAKIGLPDEKAPQEDNHIPSDETILENATKSQENECPTSEVCRVELRKFPSFDFGLEKTNEESDRTPLLYKDNTGPTARSLSSNSEAEEKPMIRMEIRSNSESSTRDDLSLNQPNNDSVSYKEKGIALESSPRSTKGSEKRKPRSSSSLFTTCMCCTAVIN